MIKFAGESLHPSFILGTENGLLYPISKAYPGKKFYPASEKMVCGDMKKITLEKILLSLETLSGRVTVPKDIRKKAWGAVQKMIEL
jgi:quinolinate synthase